MFFEGVFAIHNPNFESKITFRIIDEFRCDVLRDGFLWSIQGSDTVAADTALYSRYMILILIQRFGIWPIPYRILIQSLKIVVSVSSLYQEFLRNYRGENISKDIRWTFERHSTGCLCGCPEFQMKTVIIL